MLWSRVLYAVVTRLESWFHEDTCVILFLWAKNVSPLQNSLPTDRRVWSCVMRIQYVRKCGTA